MPRSVSRTVFARDRRAPEVVVLDEGVTHRVAEMTIDLDADFVEQPYGAECGRLVSGCLVVDAPVDCLECLAGREALIEALKRRLSP